MKFMAFLVTAIALAFASIVHAEARSVQTQIHEVLRHVQIDGQQTPYIGLLDIDFTKKQIQVRIVQDPCGQYADQEPGTIRCMAAAMVRETLRVPLQNVNVDSCNSLRMSGSFGATLDEQSITSIEVADHQRRRCMDKLHDALEVKATKASLVNGPTTEYRLTK